MKTMSETGVRAYARASRVVADAIHAKADSTLRRIQVRLALRYCVGNPARGLSCLVAIAVPPHALDAETARMADAIMEDIDPTEQDLELRDSYSRTIWRIAYQNRSDAPLDDGSTVEEVSQTEGDPTLRDLDDADSGEQPDGHDDSESVALVVPEDPTMAEEFGLVVEDAPTVRPIVELSEGEDGDEVEETVADDDKGYPKSHHDYLDYIVSTCGVKEDVSDLTTGDFAA